VKIHANDVTGVLLDDGWHTPVTGKVKFDWEPSVVDQSTGVEATPVGGCWILFDDSAGGSVAAPMTQVRALKH